MSYVDDGTLIASSKTYAENQTKHSEAYHFIHEATEAMGLILEHSKSEAFHFSKRRDGENPPIDLGFAPFTGDTPLVPKEIWRYLGFFFDRKLSFREHCRRYANKALTSVRAMYSLGNGARGLRPEDRRLLYRTCVLPIATYGSRLWYFEGSPIKGPLKDLQRMQHQACIWIAGAFRTSPTGGLEALAGVRPIPPH